MSGQSFVDTDMLECARSQRRSMSGALSNASTCSTDDECTVRRRVKELEKTLTKQKEQKEQLARDIEAASKMKQETESITEALENSVEEIIDTEERLNGEIAGQKKELSKLKRDAIKSHQAFRRTSGELYEEERRAHEAREAACEHSKDLENILKLIESATHRYAAVQEEMKQARFEFEKATASAKEAEAKAENAEALAKVSQELRTELKQRIEEVQAKLASKVASLNELRQDCQTMELRRDELKDDLAKLSRDIDGMREERKCLVDENERLTETREKLQRKIQALSLECVSLNQKCIELLEEKNFLEAPFVSFFSWVMYGHQNDDHEDKELSTCPLGNTSTCAALEAAMPDLTQEMTRQAPNVQKFYGGRNTIIHVGRDAKDFSKDMQVPHE